MGEAKAVLRDEEIERLASFPEHNPNPVIETSLEGDLTFANSAAREAFPELSENPSDHAVLADLEVFRDAARADMVDVREIRVGDRIYERWVRAVPRARVVRVFVFDITKRVRAETRRRESEARYRAFMELAGDPMFVMDRDTRIADVNERACESLGYTREHLMQLRLRDFDLSAREREDGALWHDLAGGAPLTLAGTHQRRDGATFPVEVTSRRVDVGGTGLIVSLARDVTATRQAEARCTVLEGRLERLREAVETVTAGLPAMAEDLDEDVREGLQRLGEALREAIGSTGHGPDSD